MRCERLLIILLLMILGACSRDESAPREVSATPPPTATIAPQSPPRTAASYDEAMVWLKSTPGFHFVIDEAGVHAEGDMTRPTVGAEKIAVRANGDEWSAEAGPQGVAWKKGGNPAAAPEWGNRLYQRVTLAFDPQKKEGMAQLASSEGESSLYRFTNANTGEVHEVWVSNADNHVERIKIGGAMEMVITNPQR